MANLTRKAVKSRSGRSDQGKSYWKFLVLCFANSAGEFESVCVAGSRSWSQKIGLLLNQLFSADDQSSQRQALAFLKNEPRLIGARSATWKRTPSKLRPERLRKSALECLAEIGGHGTVGHSRGTDRLLEASTSSHLQRLTQAPARDVIDSVGARADQRPFAGARSAIRELHFLLETESFENIKRDKLLAKEIERLRSHLNQVQSKKPLERGRAAVRQGTADGKEQHGPDVSELITVRAAARRLGVHHRSIRMAIANGKLEAFALADGRPVVRLKECQRLWPKGPNPQGRPKGS